MTIHTALLHSHIQILPFKESLLAMIGTYSAVVLAVFDQTVVGTTLPTVVAELKDFELYVRAAASYLLTSAMTVPIFDRLGDFHGRKPFVIVSTVVLMPASVMCGMAGGVTFLMWSRTLQGVGGGMLVDTAYTCIPNLFLDARVCLHWQAMLNTFLGIANVIGLTSGEWTAQALG